MSIHLNHTIVPARDKEISAQFFANLFGLPYRGPVGPFAPVQVNDTLTLDFDDRRKEFDWHHYAFHVNDEEFDSILNRVQAAGLPYGSTPWSLDDKLINHWKGGRGVYFRELNGHILELLTHT